MVSTTLTRIAPLSINQSSLNEITALLRSMHTHTQCATGFPDRQCEEIILALWFYFSLSVSFFCVVSSGFRRAVVEYTENMVNLRCFGCGEAC